MSDPRKRNPFLLDHDHLEEAMRDENIVTDDIGEQYDVTEYGGPDDGNTVYSDADPGL